MLENRINELKAIIYLEKNKENSRHTNAYITNYFRKALTFNSINFVYYLVRKIIIDNENIEIYLECPYHNNFTTEELIDKINYKQTYKTKCKQETIIRDISVFI